MPYDAAEMLANLYSGTTVGLATGLVPSLATPSQDPGPVDQVTTNHISESYTEWCWQNIKTVDLDYLTAPRRHPDACPWCGGRLNHNPLCDDLRAGWEPTISFGKYKGKKLSEVPDDYLHWLAEQPGGVPDDLRAAIRDRKK